MKLLFRRVCVALCFASFGIICMIGNLFFIPVIILRLNQFKIVENFARDLVFVAWRVFLYLIVFYGYAKIDFRAKFVCKDSTIVIANHPSLLDVVLLLSHIRRANCIVKASLAKNIFLFGAIKSANYILNTENEKMLELSKKALQNGENLIIFPEGTRTKDKICMQKGAFYIAINCAKELIALGIKMSPKSLKKGQSWYDTPQNKIKYEVDILENLDLSEFEKSRSNPIRVRLLHEKMQNLYERQDL
ncbi:MAG: 1-acyl-sn-glycerol-3-phosphate acyltransferase [Campylobacter sp.]|nr:1-acyl-sn-glycerol-3-phosphate acyltransferase [Campylobacter sp.]